MITVISPPQVLPSLLISFRDGNVLTFGYVDSRGFEPLTYWLQTSCSTKLS